MAIVYIYRFVLCFVAAFYVGPLLGYFINSIPIPESTAVWACVLSAWFLFERVLISVRTEAALRKYIEDEMDRPD